MENQNRDIHLFLEENLFSSGACVEYLVSATFQGTCFFSSHKNYVYYSHSQGHVELESKRAGTQVPPGFYLCMLLHESNTLKDKSLL